MIAKTKGGTRLILKIVRASSSAVVAATLGVACSSAPSRDSGPSAESFEAARASKTYLDDLNVVAADDARSGSEIVCRVPDEAKEAQPNLGHGQSRIQSRSWRRLVAVANACVRSKNWTNVETLGNALARADIDSPWGVYFLSLAAEAQGEVARAVWMIDLAQKKSGGNSGLFYYQKGRLLFLTKDTVGAIKEIEKALNVDPRFAEGHIFLGDIYRRDMETERARSCYLAALKIDPQNHRATLALSELKSAPSPSAPSPAKPAAPGGASTADIKTEMNNHAQTGVTR